MNDIFGNENITKPLVYNYKMCTCITAFLLMIQTKLQEDVDIGISYDEFNRFILTPFVIGHCIKGLNQEKMTGINGSFY